MEVYNDNIFDLLDVATAPHEISTYEDRPSRHVNIVGLRTVTVSSEKEALALLFEVCVCACMWGTQQKTTPAAHVQCACQVVLPLRRCTGS